jgi:formiminotetrahydrofolate cyclodeaminase
MAADVEAAVELISTGLRAASACARANLDGLRDRKYAAEVRRTARNLTRRARIAAVKTTRTRSRPPGRVSAGGRRHPAEPPNR